jgi:hypothetical protein
LSVNRELAELRVSIVQKVVTLMEKARLSSVALLAIRYIHEAVR